MGKLNVAVIFGGTNTEHEVSLVSARSILNNLDPQKYNVLPILITKQNQWKIPKGLITGPIAAKQIGSKKSFTITHPTVAITKDNVDVIFPVLHGPFGEDGTIQGMLEMMKVPYVGCGVLASALCMDKVIQKQVCSVHNIPQTKYSWISSRQWENDQQPFVKKIESEISYPAFVKPANQGSSVGVSKVKNSAELIEAIDEALNFDHKIIVETAVPHTREIECSILGNDKPIASVLGEIIPSNEFYDYNAKYIDGKSKEIIPAKLPSKVTKSIRTTAIEAFKLVNCTGLARVDFLVEKGTNKFYLNELNTMPGFTSISMYPKLWQASGIEYGQLIDKLIKLAQERHQQRSQVNYSYTPKSAWHKS